MVIEWEDAPLKTICVKIQDGTHFSPVVNGGEYLYVTSRNIGYGTFDISDVSRIDAYQHSEIYKRCDVEYGDLLLTKDGANTGNAVINPLWQEFSLLSSVAFLRFDPNQHDARFYLQQILSYSGQQQIKDAMSGNAITRLTLEKIKNLSFKIAPLPEQHCIAEVLSDTDSLISSLEKLIAKKKAIKQGTMQELLTGKRRLPGFEGDWIEKSFANLFTINGGLSASRDQLSQDGFCYLHYGDIHSSTKQFIDVELEYAAIPKLNIELKKVSHTALLSNGDVVFVDASEDDEGASRHIVIRNPKAIPFISGLHTIVCSAKGNDLVKAYREYCFSTERFREQIKHYAAGTKVTGVSKSNLGKILLQYPNDIDEQAAIASILSDMDAEIEQLEKKLSKYRLIKQGMMQELLTGRIRLVETETTKKSATKAAKKSGGNYNDAYKDAVLLVALVNSFGTEQYPFTAFDCQKFPYLLHRHLEGEAKRYKEFAAGPYDPAIKYKTARPIALKKHYIREHTGNYKGFVAADNAQEALSYFSKWYGEEPLKWMEQFRYMPKRKDELELLTTVDMAVVRLRKENVAINVSAVKNYIHSSKEWKRKLERELFSDKNIERAIGWSNELFGEEA